MVFAGVEDIICKDFSSWQNILGLESSVCSARSTLWYDIYNKTNNSIILSGWRRRERFKVWFCQRQRLPRGSHPGTEISMHVQQNLECIPRSDSRDFVGTWSEYRFHLEWLLLPWILRYSVSSSKIQRMRYKIRTGNWKKVAHSTTARTLLQFS
jgi:hypothetical protein